MRRIYLIIIAFLVLVNFVIWKGIMGKRHSVLGIFVTATPTLTSTPVPTLSTTPSPTPTLTPSPTLIPTTTPTPTPFPQPELSSQEIHALMERFASQYGIDPNVLRHVAGCESGFRQFASNGNYAGLYQFAPTTWRNLRMEIGEDIRPDFRYNAEEAVQTAAFAIANGKRNIWPNCYP